ncbi:DUF1753-domain-containing protein [Glonium stellatum]|uniref:DUF1753-domain-containing protein n=1 Tax=Glonium stellatum TaxID=574774 RepID=A0A8E2EYK3_9PEZI|nr:DUF1753-domain-containing protein [Glonium stellatum]
MAPLHLFEIPRPKAFFNYMSLRTGAEIITFLMLLNKISGFYGILALLTGAPLTSLQFSMYLYSLLALCATVYLSPHIRRASPLQCLALAHLYAFDTVLNALYTAAFGVAWFYVLAQHGQDGKAAVPGAGGISTNAGFTNPKYNVSSVEVVAAPAGGLAPGQDAVASGSFMSLSVIAVLWALRVYFVFVLLAFARQVLRQHVATTSSVAWGAPGAPQDSLAENPFAEGREEGEGWRGKLGRAMLAGAPRYWLGADEDGEWMRGLGGKFRKSMEPVGVVERERRRRSGTGPPAPPRELVGQRLADLTEVR